MDHGIIRFINQYITQEDLADSLSENSFSVIMDPSGTFYVGEPYSKRFTTVNSLEKFFKGKGLVLSKLAKEKLSSMDGYGINIFSISDGMINLEKPNYIYSIPSYGGA